MNAPKNADQLRPGDILAGAELLEVRRHGHIVDVTTVDGRKASLARWAPAPTDPPLDDADPDFGAGPSGAAPDDEDDAMPDQDDDTPDPAEPIKPAPRDRVKNKRAPKGDGKSDDGS